MEPGTGQKTWPAEQRELIWKAGRQEMTRKRGMYRARLGRARKETGDRRLREEAAGLALSRSTGDAGEAMAQSSRLGIVYFLTES